MPENEPNDPAKRWDLMEREALYRLTEPDRYPPVWSVADLARELDYFDAEAIIRPLIRAGLLHRIAEKFVVAAPAAYRWVQLVGHVS